MALADLWPDFTVFVYQYFFVHVYYLNMTFHDEASRRYSRINKTSKRLNHGFEIMSKKRCDDATKQFDRYFGIIILAQLSYYLVNTAAMIVMASDTRLYGKDVVIELPYHLRYTLIFVASLATICFAQEKIRDWNDQLSRYAVSMDPKVGSGTHALTSELATQVPITGMGQFVVEPSLLLSFGGSMVSFTVLLIQMAG
ncbi:hypothetical protein HDE_07787 [Halotydeus destructor]|nr:hypothetical protein HDE_07787 [Halotydeus destructor]